MPAASQDSSPALAPLRRSLAPLWIVGLVGLIGVILWRVDYRFSQPTPRPADWQPVALGSEIELPESVLALAPDGRPLLIHYFNPDCPCSRFNLDHAIALADRFEEELQSVLIVEGGPRAAKAARKGFRHVIEADRELTRALGLYSTPTAALLDSNRQLVFAGNYTVTRYCSDPSQRSLERVIEALLDEGPSEALSLSTRLAHPSFGCAIPSLEGTP